MRYILYLTVNMVNHKVYIGVHKTNPEIFDGYLGSGTALKQAIKKYGKHNFKRIILKEFPFTEEGKKLVYEAEEKIVNEKIVKSKYTYNLTIGGKSEPNNIIHNLNKTVYQFDLQGNLLKVWKSATLASQNFYNPSSARVAICNVCTNITRQAYGYYWSYTNKFNYIAFGTAVAKYSDDGTFIESYTKIKDAAIANNIKTPANIVACIKGKQKRCGGFRWRYFYGNKSNIKPL